MSKSREYPVTEVYDYFLEETEKVKQILSKRVNAGKIKPIDAREKYDMYRSMLVYLKVCVNMAEAEDYLEDNSFSMRWIYARNDEVSKGTKKLAKAAKLLEDS